MWLSKIDKQIIDVHLHSTQFYIYTDDGYFAVWRCVILIYTYIKRGWEGERERKRLYMRSYHCMCVSLKNDPPSYFHFLPPVRRSFLLPVTRKSIIIIQSPIHTFVPSKWYHCRLWTFTIPWGPVALICRDGQLRELIPMQQIPMRNTAILCFWTHGPPKPQIIWLVYTFKNLCDIRHEKIEFC